MSISLPSNIDDLISIFEEVLELSPSQTYILQRILEEHKDLRSLDELLTFIEGLNVDARWVLESKYSLIRRIYPLASFNKFRMGVIKDIPEPLNMVAKGKILIIDLSSIGNSVVKKLIAISLLKLLEYGWRIWGKNRVFVILEEVHNILSLSSHLLERLISEVRKVGIGLILVTQSPSILGYRIITNANVRIIHTLRFKDDINVMCKSLGDLGSCHTLLPRLGVGKALVDYTPLSMPLLVDIFPPTYILKNFTNVSI